MAEKDPHLRNAVASQPSQSLSTTIQNVITKAVTHPNDPKSDFAQGVNHITGDPHQKSAGKADAMQSLKAQNDSETEVKEQDEKKPEEIKANAEKEKELKANAEKEKEKVAEQDEKEKEVVKAQDEKEDEKKKELKAQDDKKDDVKEQDEKKPEELTAQEIKDKEKELKAQAEKEKEVKEEDEKEADKKKELKAQEIKDKIKSLDVKEDVKALVSNDADLSDEFKTKAATIFEAAVKNKIADEVIRMEDEYESKVESGIETAKDEMTEKVDAYLNYVVEQWMKDNELAIEKGLKTEITEDFIGGLKSLFDNHYIDVPQEKENVLDNQAAKIEELENKLNKSIEENVELNSQIGNFKRDEILQDVGSDLADTEKDKFKGLADNIEYKDAEDFKVKLETVKESYFPRKKASDESNDVADTNTESTNENLEGSMAAYSAAISKMKAKKLY